MGFKLSGNPAMEAGLFEPDETQLVSSVLAHVEVMINVGANIGYYACLALSRGKQVVAFEPVARNLEYLLRNIKANGWESSAEVFPIALSDKVGVTKIYGSGTGASLVRGWSGIPENYSRLVPMSTMDKVVGSRFAGRKCLVLVDIEGAEQLMLDGASYLLDMTPKPLWFVEIVVSEHQPRGRTLNPTLLRTFSTFLDRGYEAWTASSQPRLVEAEEVARVQSTGRDTLATHNFLFVGKGTGESLFFGQ